MFLNDQPGQTIGQSTTPGRVDGRFGAGRAPILRPRTVPPTGGGAPSWQASDLGILIRHGVDRVDEQHHQRERPFHDRLGEVPARHGDRSPPGLAFNNSSIAAEPSTPWTSKPRSASGSAMAGAHTQLQNVAVVGQASQTINRTVGIPHPRCRWRRSRLLPAPRRTQRHDQRQIRTEKTPPDLPYPRLWFMPTTTRPVGLSSHRDRACGSSARAFLVVGALVGLAMMGGVAMAAGSSAVTKNGGCTRSRAAIQEGIRAENAELRDRLVVVCQSPDDGPVSTLALCPCWVAPSDPVGLAPSGTSPPFLPPRSLSDSNSGSSLIMSPLSGLTLGIGGPLLWSLDV